MQKFHLFRIKIIQPRDTELPFKTRLSSTKLIEEGIKNLELVEVRRSQSWRIGNFNRIDEHRFTFCFGRILVRGAIEYDSDKHEYIIKPHSDARLAEVYVDSQLQFAAISSIGTQQLSLHSVPRNLAGVMLAQPSVNDHRVNIAFDSVPDSESFLEHIKAARKVIQFSYSIKNPNPFSAKDFDKPAKDFMQLLRAQEMEARVKGDDLNREQIEHMTNAATMYGSNVKAKIQTDHGESKQVSTGHMPKVISTKETDPLVLFENFASFFKNSGDLK